MAGWDWQGIQTINSIHSRSSGILQMWSYAFWTGECLSYISETDENVSGWPSTQLSDLSWWYNHVFENTKRQPGLVERGLPETKGIGTEI